MSKSSPGPLIRLRGVRHNNLKNFDLDLPAGRLIVITGPSGSGKSSLAFDTLYAEGQRRYIETFSPYARQFFDRMDKPQVDSIQGIPPAIAIEQRNTVKSTRSTVATMTELCEYMKVLWVHVAQLYCRNCGNQVHRDSPQSVWQKMQQATAGQSADAVVTFDLALSDRLSVDEALSLIAKQGYQRLLFAQGSARNIVRVEEAAERIKTERLHFLTVIQDRLRFMPASRTRCIEAFEQAYHFGKGKLSIDFLDGTRPRRFSNRWHCPDCDLEYREPTPALFSFNNPLGACPTCRGFGRTITIDYARAVPDRSLPLAGGAVKPWQTGHSAECQEDLAKFCRIRGVPMTVPFRDLKPEWQRWVMDGDPGYGPGNEWPKAWYGVKGYFRWLESKAYKMHVRVLLSRYRSYEPCSACGGRRFQPESLQFKRAARDGHLLTLSDFYKMPVSRALDFIEFLEREFTPASGADAMELVLSEVLSRLRYLQEVGLGYVTLDRPTRSLSGGETERVNLTTCLGSRLVNTLFVLDEPTVGLHPRDTGRLITILQRLRNAGNTVLVVEHEPSVMAAADQIVDLGPGQGETGGQLVFQGSYREILKNTASITGRYLSGELSILPTGPRPTAQLSTDKSARGCNGLRVLHATCHNLQDLSVTIPLQRLVCITGVSGSGKTTLVRDILWPTLSAKFGGSADDQASESDEENGGDELNDVSVRPSTLRIEGWEQLGRVVLVDQSPLGKTPRSNPAVYIGAFEHIRELFAQSEDAKQRGLNASAFSFNSAQGQCEQCRGAGFEKVEMQFLSDVFVRCPACQGRRYREHILAVRLPNAVPVAKKSSRQQGSATGTLAHPNISDLLDATTDAALELLKSFADSRPAARAAQRLQLLQDVGLGYLRLGQPINTLSGGESQRLKLVSHLAEFAAADARERKPTLFLLDEPTTGLHFADVDVLVRVFQRLVDQGHSVVVIEHNLDLIRCADWILDLGPEAGDGGGKIVAEGPPQAIAAVESSHTGRSLRR
jgi:excinuclease ABC subunit A